MRDFYPAFGDVALLKTRSVSWLAMLWFRIAWIGFCIAGNICGHVPMAEGRR